MVPSKVTRQCGNEKKYLGKFEWNDDLAVWRIHDEHYSNFELNIIGANAENKLEWI